MNLGTAVIARMNIILGTLTLGICLDLYYFQYCCTISRNSWDVLRKICNQLFSTLYLVFANIFICFQFPRNHIKDCCPKFATGLKCLQRHTVFPHIVSALEQFPPLNSFRTCMYCYQRSQYIRLNSKKNSFRGNYMRKYGIQTKIIFCHFPES